MARQNSPPEPNRYFSEAAIQLAKTRGVPVTGRLIAEVMTEAILHLSDFARRADSDSMDYPKVCQAVINDLASTGRSSMIGEGLRADATAPPPPATGDRVRLTSDLTMTDGATIAEGMAGVIVQPTDPQQAELFKAAGKSPVLFDTSDAEQLYLIYTVLLEPEMKPSPELEELRRQIWNKVGGSPYDPPALGPMLDRVIELDLEFATQIAAQMDSMYKSQMVDVGLSVRNGGEIDASARRAADDCQFIRDYLVSQGAQPPQEAAPSPASPEPVKSKRWWKRS